MKKAYIILGNGFTIDFLHHYTQYNVAISNEIDVRNLFRLGDIIDTPWDNKPGFLSYKHCPSLWTLGARPGNTVQESNALIEEIITCANMFFDFVNDPDQKTHRLEMLNSRKDRIHLKAYSELIVYLRHLFSSYNEKITDADLKDFFEKTNWGWAKFFKSLSSKKYDKITFVTYNYDIWLERILRILDVDFFVEGFETGSSANIEIIKPHGSISFVPKKHKGSTYSISYSLDFEGVSIDQLEISYNSLKGYEKGAIIPPAGDSSRLDTTAPWSKYLRDKAREAATDISEHDDIVLCGISYWHVDRRELDELLLSLNQDSAFAFINPAPPRDLIAVLTCIFKNYVQQTSSAEIGGILNG